MSTVFNDQDNDFGKIKLTILDRIVVNTNPTIDKELSKKKYIDGSIRDGCIIRSSQSLQNYLKVFVGNTENKLTKYDRIQVIDTIAVKYLNQG